MPLPKDEEFKLGHHLSFGFFFGFWGISNLKPLGFLTRKRDDFERKIVVKTWWLSAKTWSFGGC
jgi:hypothetical protein